MSGLLIIAIIAAAIFAFLFLATLTFLVIAVIFVFRYGKMVVQWEENITTSLDMLDQSYATFTRLGRLPLFHDTPEVRQLMAEIENCRNAVLFIANALTLPAQVRPNQLEQESVNE